MFLTFLLPLLALFTLNPGFQKNETARVRRRIRRGIFRKRNAEMPKKIKRLVIDSYLSLSSAEQHVLEQVLFYKSLQHDLFGGKHITLMASTASIERSGRAFRGCQACCQALLRLLRLRQAGHPVLIFEELFNNRRSKPRRKKTLDIWYLGRHSMSRFGDQPWDSFLNVKKNEKGGTHSDRSPQQATHWAPRFSQMTYPLHGLRRS